MRWNLSLKIPIEFAPALAANLPKSVGKPTTTKNRSFDFDPKKKCEKKNIRHPRLPRGPPPQY